MAQPTNCYFCKNTWLGAGPVCDDCQQKIGGWSTQTHRQPPPPPVCGYCGGGHSIVDCLMAALDRQKQQAAMLRATMTLHKRPRRHGASRPFSNYQHSPPLKACPKCRGNYMIESKAGSVCSNCREVVHNPCRNCGLPNTRGLTGDATQFIECNDCQFIE